MSFGGGCDSMQTLVQRVFTSVESLRGGRERGQEAYEIGDSKLA